MDRRLVIIAAALALACTDRPDMPPAPAFSHQSDVPCDVNALNSLVAQYFSPPSQQQAREYLGALRDAGGRTETARDRGFDILALMAQAVASGGAGSPATGSALVNGLIVCMFDPAGGPDDFPHPFPVDFTVSLTPDAAGAFAVRAATADATPVLARGLVPQSGIAPPQGSTWADLLAERVLIYGFPISATVYDWAFVRPGASFGGPGAIVGLCLAGGSVMVHESSVGLLAFSDPYFLPASCDATAAAPFAPVDPLGALGRFAAGLLLPRPLHATTFLSPGGVGGLAGGLRSQFRPEDVPTANTEFLSQPLNSRVNEPIPTSPAGGIVVQVTSGAFTVPGTSVSLVARDNNGATVQLTCPDLPGAVCTGVTGLDGRVAFGSPVLNKTGGYRFETTGTVSGRTTAVNLARSKKFNVRP